MRQDAKSAVMVNALYSIFRDYDGGPAQKEELKVHPTLAKLYRDAQLEDLQFNVKVGPGLSELFGTLRTSIKALLANDYFGL